MAGAFGGDLVAGYRGPAGQEVVTFTDLSGALRVLSLAQPNCPKGRSFRAKSGTGDSFLTSHLSIT